VHTSFNRRATSLLTHVIKIPNNCCIWPTRTPIPKMNITWSNDAGRSSKNRISVDYHFWHSQTKHDSICHSFPGMCRLEILSPSTHFSLRMSPYKVRPKVGQGGGNAWEPIRGLRPGVAHPKLLNKNPGNQEMGLLVEGIVVGWLLFKTVRREGPNPGRSSRCGSWLLVSIAGYSERPLNFYLNWQIDENWRTRTQYLSKHIFFSSRIDRVVCRCDNSHHDVTIHC
jgi:hypothetical protein